MVQPLNIRTVKTAVKGARQYVQDEKIQISRRTITRFQYAEKWPDEYLSYVTSERSRNEYKDPDTFFRVMHFKPEWYARKFIFRPLIDTSDQIRQATIDAFQMIITKTQGYIAAPNAFGSPNRSSGFYASMFKIQLDGSTITNLSQLDNLNNDSVTRIYNAAPYAGTIEKNAIYYAGIGGVIYYAARMIQKQYPHLGVRFVYNRAATMPGTISRYDVPTLSIGTRSRVISRIKRPGRNFRRRERIRRSR